MADQHASVEQNPHRFLNTIAVVMLLCVIGALAALVLTAPEVPTIDETSFRTDVTVDEGRLAEERAELYGQVDLSKAGDKVKELQQSVRAANLLQFGQPSPEQIRDATVLNVYNANELLTATNIEGVMLAGNDVFEACQKAFTELQRALASQQLTVEQARTDPGEAFAAYRENCGNAFPVLEEIQIVRPTGEWADPSVGPTMLDILNRFRWATVLDARKPAQQQLTPYEYELLTRWRAANTTFPVERRIQWVMEAARELPDLAENELVGNLLFESGEVAAAADAYGEVCKKKKNDIVLQAKCEWLAARVAAPAAH